jgi:hypothetical protein
MSATARTLESISNCLRSWFLLDEFSKLSFRGILFLMLADLVTHFRAASFFGSERELVELPNWRALGMTGSAGDGHGGFSMVSGPVKLLKGQMTASPMGVSDGPAVMSDGEILH